jgi:hypothetical protein
MITESCYFDARPTVVRANGANELVVGDDAGRVHLLAGVGFETSGRFTTDEVA